MVTLWGLILVDLEYSQRAGAGTDVVLRGAHHGVGPMFKLVLDN